MDAASGWHVNYTYDEGDMMQIRDYPWPLGTKPGVVQIPRL